MGKVVIKIQFTEKLGLRVYYSNTYYPRRCRYDDWVKAEDSMLSDLMIAYKHHDSYAADCFDATICNAIFQLVRELNISGHVYFVSVPSAKADNETPVNKSIAFLVNVLGIFSCVFCDASYFLTRHTDIKRAHECIDERPSVENHTNSIIFNGFIDPNGTYILLDDIVTQGTVMRACTDILTANGIPEEKIYHYAIMRTYY